MKPKIRLLQKFANHYFKRGKCPLVRWKAKKKILGMADTENNRIYLNPKISRESSWRYFITDNFQALGERLHLFEGEQFFMILLFQIKFFKRRAQEYCLCALCAIQLYFSFAQSSIKIPLPCF
jgi:hypothetical protein